MDDDKKQAEALPKEFLSALSELKKEYEEESAEAKRNGEDIGIYSERFGELEEIIKKLIDDKNKVRKRIKSRKADVWDIAHIIQLAKYNQKFPRQAQENFNSARATKKEAKKTMKRRIKKIEKDFKRPFKDLEEHYQNSHFYDDEEGLIKKYFEAEKECDHRKFIRDNLSGSKPLSFKGAFDHFFLEFHKIIFKLSTLDHKIQPNEYALLQCCIKLKDSIPKYRDRNTSPTEKALSQCCMRLMDYLNKKKASDSVYKLISDIINMFDLTPHTQNANNIRQRIFQAKH